jgi:hypothetical protein
MADNTNTRHADHGGAGTAEQGQVVLLVATRKGAWLYHGDAARENWRVDGPHFLGHIISHLVLDPRDGQDPARCGQDGTPRSDDLPLDRSSGAAGAKRSARPLSLRAAKGPPLCTGLPGRTVDHTFWLTPGNA